MVQLNPVPVFGVKKNTSTSWRKFSTEIFVQMVSALGSSAQFLAARGLQKKSESWSLGYIIIHVCSQRVVYFTYQFLGDSLR